VDRFALSYVLESDPFWKRSIMRAIENLSGRRRLMPVYDRWSARAATHPQTMMNDLLELIGTRLAIAAPAWPPSVAADTPLVMIGNHPFGIGDGIAMLALAEQLGRPYKVLINADFLRIPEIRANALPIDFSATRQAIQTNLDTRKAARRALKEGATLVVFPAGGVATADRVFGKAEELPWKPFTARLIQDAEASVLPVYFEGQNSALFHLVSHYSLGLRLALMVSEFRRSVGTEIKVHVGAPIAYEALAARDDRLRLTEALYIAVHRLAPGAAQRPDDALRPTPAGARRRYPWDPPARTGNVPARAAERETSDAF
jgi:putative hemolysin